MLISLLALHYLQSVLFYFQALSISLYLYGLVADSTVALLYVMLRLSNSINWSLTGICGSEVERRDRYYFLSLNTISFNQIIFNFISSRQLSNIFLTSTNTFSTLLQSIPSWMIPVTMYLSCYCIYALVEDIGFVASWS